MVERCPYQAIMIAAANGRGVHLTAQEAHDLACDDAIETVANKRLSDEDGARWHTMSQWEFWRKFGRSRSPSPETRKEGNAV